MRISKVMVRGLLRPSELCSSDPCASHNPFRKWDVTQSHHPKSLNGWHQSTIGENHKQHFYHRPCLPPSLQV
ncbi:Uncharacterized protein TCM_009279 [Theobroma cacao]|uniref:Uncharacterized protein n=1 Tax=Theobroma cacao TaxID=3641 RepID=A0A061ECI1_THECC|nr:Uncharacterized protein TCM_009279 [Theobroma cacao]